jgi:phytoene dehydrogenase-like protein
MSNGTDRSDALVVGGGLAGLVAAVYLGRGGLRVTLVERASELGGRASTTRDGGFAMNRGPHALFVRGEALETLRELGVPVPSGAAPIDGHALSRGELHRLPVGSLSLFSTTLLGFRDKAAFAGLLAKIPRLDPRPLAGKSIAEWLDDTGASPDVRALMETFFRLATYANAPDRASVETAIRQVQKAAAGVLYVDGGWKTLTDGLLAQARRLGVRLVPGARATSLGHAAGGYAVGLADGRVLEGRTVVLAVAPRHASALVQTAGIDVPGSLSSSEPVRAAALDVALSALPNPEKRFVIGVDRPLYLSVHSTVAKLAPDGGALVHVAKYLPAGPSDPDADRAELEALLELAQPGYRDVLVRAEYLPRIRVAERLDLAREGGRAGRPSVALSELPGVFLAGDWVREGSWLADAAAGSARAAARAASAHVGAEKAVA